MKKTIFLFLTALIFSGCDLNLNQNKGISCNDPDAISLATDIINSQIFNEEIDKKASSKFEIDKSTIIWWDTKKVGRNLCKVKIKAKVLKADDFDNPFLTILKDYHSYGIYYDKKKKELSGWIYYQTYPVMESKDNTFYVEVLPKNDVRDW